MRLIDADALKKSKADVQITTYKTKEHYTIINTRAVKGVTVEDIDKAPTIEAEPVRHGEWRKFNDEIYCSLCECTALMGTYGGIIKSTYCPHCGAKMDGGENAEKDES